MQKTKQHPLEKTLLHELWQLIGFVSRQRQRQLSLLLILMIISSLSEVVSLGAVLPFLEALSNTSAILNNSQLQPFFDVFRIETSRQLVTGLALAFMAAVIIANALKVLTINTQTHLAARISSDISCKLYSKMMSQPYEYHIQRNSSDLIQLVTGDTRGLTNTILIPLLSLITNGCTVLALAVGLFLINWQVALIATIVLGGAYFGLYRWRRTLLKRNSQIIVQTSQQQIKVVQEGLGGIRDVLVGGTQDFFQMAYRQSDIPFRRTVAANLVIAQTPRYVIESIAMSAIALLALMLGHGGDFSQVVPVLGGLALGANRLLPALQRVFGTLVKIQGARVSLQRVLKGLQLLADPLQTFVPEQRLSLQQELRFENVWFRYNHDSCWVLQGLNMTIRAQTTVGFVGSTGSGKSTTADLILGLLKPQKGELVIDGNYLKNERLRQWQQSIAHVPQSIFLTDATIAENIAFGIPLEHIDIERVYRAARLARIDEYIQELPNQYDTYVGERGVRLSGGQRQRIGIARALYRQASIIVFDEATSALDNSTEREVMEAINGLSHQFTIILIAHRLSTLEKCDQIIEFHQGRVVATGSYEELMQRSGSFCQMSMSVSS